MKRPIAVKLSEAAAHGLHFNFNGVGNALTSERIEPVSLLRYPMSYEEYRKKFDIVQQHLYAGDSYLTNLTIKTEIKTTATLDEIFRVSNARYKLLYKDQFVVFSPEIFVNFSEHEIFSFPMKGTINAALKNASEKILSNKKELAEHVTITDLIRNDLSKVATNVRVKRFRYIDELKTTEGELLQVSSEIAGDISEPFKKIGTMLLELLPAGSVTGAPKNKTVEIIHSAEGEPRGYYTGVMGIFDGTFLDSGVMIRFIEKTGGKLFYRSGGGITAQSDCLAEYLEAIEKIYVPIN